jgi:hypothetical protein
MKKTLLLALILVFAVVGNAGAITWTYAGGVFDQQIFDSNNDWAPYNYHDVYGEIPDNVPSPGGAIGEMFDFEGVKCAMDDEYLYFAVTASFGMGVDYRDFFYKTGDFFFGLDGTDTQFGIDFDQLGLYAVGSNFSYIPPTPYGYYNNTSVKLAVGAFDIDEQNAMIIGSADRMIHNGLTEYVTGDTHVSELRIAKSYLADYGVDFSQISEINYRQTIACGNDYIEGQCNVVPEPTTLALLGLGLMGTGIFARRKK